MAPEPSSGGWLTGALLLVTVVGTVAGTLALPDRPIVWVPWIAAVILATACCLMARRRSLALRRVAADSAAETAQSRAILADVLAALVDPILSIDELGVVLSANPAVERVFGWREDELVGRNISVLMGQPYRDEHDDYISNYLRTGEPRAIGRVRKVLGRRRTGEEFACELSVSEIRGPAGRMFWGLVRDVSDRESFAMRMAQVERLVAVGELAAGVAHEVNNPVNTIINCAQLIKRGDRDPQLCDHVINEGVRIAGFVRQLLDLAADREEPVSHVALREPLDRALSLLSVRMRHGGVEVVAKLNGLPAVVGRPRRLQQVFLNLLMNARDALATTAKLRQPRIEIRGSIVAAPSGPMVELVFRDNGPGIPPHSLDRIFQPFFTTKDEGEGTGLGLAVSSGIIRDLGGTLTARSELGAWTEFVVRLPAVA